MAFFEQSTEDDPPRGYVRAAQYLRMSTDRQQYSIENQAEALQHYAAARGMLIVQTYADEGRSGLTIKGRPALEQLMADVQAGAATFSQLLVYDVSRWGRFQEPDEGAYYEHLCRLHGITVTYCAETFANESSPMASIVKAMKRVMAGEYSRELSDKIWRSQAAMVKRGYKCGGPAPFGLRRARVGPDGTIRGILERGEQKALLGERVIFVPGPPQEVALVRRVYRLFLKGWNLRRLAIMLNEQGARRTTGYPWYGEEVRLMLRCEAYIGNSIYNRRSKKLKQPEVVNPPDQWIRAEGAFEPIIQREHFDAAQKLLAARAAIYARRASRTHEDMLEEVRAHLARTGEVSLAGLDDGGLRYRGDAYRQQLGGILAIRQKLGISGPKDHHFLVDVPARRALRQALLDEIEAGYSAVGAQVHRLRSPRIVVNGSLSLLVYLTPAYRTDAKREVRWTVRLDRVRECDLVLCVRLEPDSNTPRDFLLIPVRAAPTECLTFGADDASNVFKIPNLATLYAVLSAEDVAALCAGKAERALRGFRTARKRLRRTAGPRLLPATDEHVAQKRPR